MARSGRLGLVIIYAEAMFVCASGLSGARRSASFHDFIAPSKSSFPSKTCKCHTYGLGTGTHPSCSKQMHSQTPQDSCGTRPGSAQARHDIPLHFAALQPQVQMCHSLAISALLPPPGHSTTRSDRARSQKLCQNMRRQTYLG